jgi:hypothetical protein
MEIEGDIKEIKLAVYDFVITKGDEQKFMAFIESNNKIKNTIDKIFVSDDTINQIRSNIYYLDFNYLRINEIILNDINNLEERDLKIIDEIIIETYFNETEKNLIYSKIIKNNNIFLETKLNDNEESKRKSVLSNYDMDLILNAIYKICMFIELKEKRSLSVEEISNIIDIYYRKKPSSSWANKVKINNVCEDLKYNYHNDIKKFSINLHERFKEAYTSHELYNEKMLEKVIE